MTRIVNTEEAWRALKPLFDLLGVHPTEVLADGLSVGVEEFRLHLSALVVCPEDHPDAEPSPGDEASIWVRRVAVVAHETGIPDGIFAEFERPRKHRVRRAS